MKGIALSTIALFLIAIVSIIVLISFVGTNLPDTLKNTYCGVVRTLTGLVPIPEHQKQPLPPFCTGTAVSGSEQVEVITSIPQRISFELASYIVACWERTGKLNLAKDRDCYEVVLKAVDGEVTKDSVIAQLPDQYKNIVDWNISSIKNPKSVAISYSASKKLIEVI